MTYITVKQSPMYHQMSLEEFLFGIEGPKLPLNQNLTNTRTYEVLFVTDHMRRKLGISPYHLIDKLTEFNKNTEELRQRPRRELYREFHIPKKHGGLRKIDAPNDELMDALRVLKRIFEDDFKVLYHTSAFAYIKKRGTIDSIKRHQSNESRWFAKFDLHNFFGSTTLDFIMQMFSMVYPFSEVVKHQAGAEELRKALELAILDGGLPQGTPISPMITNIMMIPIDFKLSNGLRDFNDQHFVYTRYADDFLISSRFHFKFRDVEKFINDTLAGFNAPFSLNTSKTRYGSLSGSNWNLGVMLNKDNQITVGHEKKRHFKAMLTSFILDTQNGNPWDINDIQVMEGYRNYYRMVEGETIDKLVNDIGAKYHVDVVRMIKDSLKP
jgi:hypothetical protein